MRTVLHCRAYWPVVESVALKPSERAEHEYPDIVNEIVLRAYCRSKQCKKTEIYYWYPLFKTGKAGPLKRIKAREFEREWFPRFGTDKIEDAERQDRPRLVGMHTGVIHNPNIDTVVEYLARKRRIEATLVPLPVGEHAAKIIYG